MEKRQNLVLTFHNPKAPKIQGNRKYQRRRQQHVDQTHIYIRMFCGSLCGFGLLMLICSTPLSWVQFLVIKNGLELYAGLWISCSHELCWSSTPKPPYYLQISRAFFLISLFSIVVALAWLISSCLPRRGGLTTNLDLKVSMLSFIAAISLLLCLVLFLAQVHWHAKDALEPDFLWAYHINWWSDFLYTFSGIISFLNYITFRFPSLDRNVSAVPKEQSRLGVGPVTTVVPDEDESLRFDKESTIEEEKTTPESELSW
ncbi:transmembrane protein 202 isoform X3 [Lontra canadensis]|uniref:transmembrane protein 202 isoform X3 n=1 Tax=Lontra canadensis TaxID=76717 RepID=UPI0013F39C6C|nr:transmembrane protein 202 isoform X3 [Lontra canadensis]